MGKFYAGQYDEISLYVRQCAWLNVVPDKAKQSRLQKMQAEGRAPDLPEIDLPYLVDFLWEIGPTMPGGVSGAPLSHLEIMAWVELSGVDLQPWEARILRLLSADYLAEIQKARNPDCPPPYGAIERQRHVAARIDSFLD